MLDLESYQVFYKMEIIIEETKKSSTYHQFPFLWTIINWILFVYIWSMASILLVVYITLDKTKFTGEFDNLFFLMFIAIFLILGIKQRHGNFKVIYSTFFKRDWVGNVFGELHGILAIAHFIIIIVSRGDHYFGFLLYLANLLFYIGIAITIYLYIKPIWRKK